MSERDGSYQPGYEVAAERIVELIASRSLVPGDRLPTELELAETLGLSRTMVREAIKILSALGRIQVRKRRGMFVADTPGLIGSALVSAFVPADLDQLAQLFEFRTVLESTAARCAATRATPAEVKHIELSAAQSRTAAKAKDLEAFNAADDDFHNGVLTGAHNPFLASTGRSVRGLQHQAVVLGLQRGVGGSLTEAAQAHVDIAVAIRDGQPEQAAAAAARHVETTLEGYRTEIMRRMFAPATAT